jgi:uncharacterized membrane protein
MSWFIAGVTINCIAILLIIANAVYDAVTSQYDLGHNSWINLIGMILGMVVIFAFSAKNSGKLTAANILLWLPGMPLLLFSIFAVLSVLILWLSKGDWR